MSAAPPSEPGVDDAPGEESVGLSAPSISGSVVDAATGQPIRGAVVSARDPDGGSLGTTSSATGEFEILVARGVAYRMDATTEGFSAAALSAAAEGREVLARAGDVVRLALVRSIAIEGLVRAEHGAAIPDAEVAATQWLPTPSSFVGVPHCACKTNDAGRFALRGVPASGATVIRARARGYESKTATVKADEAGELVVLVLHPMTVLTGRVLGPAGADHAGFMVAVVGEQRILAHTESGSDGSFSIDAPSGGQEIIVWRLGYSPRVVPMPTRAESSALLIDVDRALTISGTVVDDERRPVAEAWVRVYYYGMWSGGTERAYSSGVQLPESQGQWALSPLGVSGAFQVPECVSDSQGRFGIPTGATGLDRTCLVAEKDDHAAALVTWAPGCGDAVIVLPRLASIEFDVRSGTSDGSVSGFVVEVKSTGDGCAVTREHSPSGERGRVSIRPGRHSIRVKAKGYRSSPREDVDLAPGEQRAIRIVLSPRN